jgi:hypothetical protein
MTFPYQNKKGHIVCARLVFLLITEYYSNKNVEIKLSAHDAFLESLSSGFLKVERLENQIIKISWEH